MSYLLYHIKDNISEIFDNKEKQDVFMNILSLYYGISKVHCNEDYLINKTLCCYILKQKEEHKELLEIEQNRLKYFIENKANMFIPLLDDDNMNRHLNHLVNFTMSEEAHEIGLELDLINHIKDEKFTYNNTEISPHLNIKVILAYLDILFK